MPHDPDRDALARAAEALPREERAVLVLTARGQTLAQAARLLGISVRAAERRLAAALTVLDRSAEVRGPDG